MLPNKLLILADDAARYHALIRAADLPQLKITTASDPGSAVGSVAACNIILGDPTAVSEVLGAAEQLEWVQSSWAGVDSLCHAGLRRDYVLTGVKDVFGPLISEYIITYLYAFERRVFRMRENQQKKIWQHFPYRNSSNIRLGIIGLGSIGRHIAQTARQFGIQVTGLNRSGKPCADVKTVYTIETMARFLKDLDYLVLTLPDTPQTKHFINADRLKLMNPSTVLMNVGRGSIINEADLIWALREDVIGGAVLDVFENEPLAQDSPLWDFHNVYVTPHHAATSFPEDIAGIFIDNYQRFIKEESLRHTIDFESGY